MYICMCVCVYLFILWPCVAICRNISPSICIFRNISTPIAISVCIGIYHHISPYITLYHHVSEDIAIYRHMSAYPHISLYIAMLACIAIRRDISVYQHIPARTKKANIEVQLCVHIRICKCNSKRQAAHVWSGRCASALAKNTILDAKMLICGVALIVDFA